MTSWIINTKRFKFNRLLYFQVQNALPNVKSVNKQVENPIKQKKNLS
jgi:hypothetical protein